MNAYLVDYNTEKWSYTDPPEPPEYLYYRKLICAETPGRAKSVFTKMTDIEDDEFIYLKCVLVEKDVPLPYGVLDDGEIDIDKWYTESPEYEYYLDWRKVMSDDPDTKDILTAYRLWMIEYLYRIVWEKEDRERDF